MKHLVLESVQGLELDSELDLAQDSELDSELDYKRYNLHKFVRMRLSLYLLVHLGFHNNCYLTLIPRFRLIAQNLMKLL